MNTHAPTRPAPTRSGLRIQTASAVAYAPDSGLAQLACDSCSWRLVIDGMCPAEVAAEAAEHVQIVHGRDGLR